MTSLYKNFWKWYEKNYLLNLSIASGLFLLQIVHLYWLFADVIMPQIIGRNLLNLSGLFYYLVLIADYTEVPALISTSLIYINESRKKYQFKNLLYLFFISTQLLHIFWITDEFVIRQLTQNQKLFIFPLWLSWIAILIDYLELPVIFDTIRRLYLALKSKQLQEVAATIKNR